MPAAQRKRFEQFLKTSAAGAIGPHRKETENELRVVIAAVKPIPVSADYKIPASRAQGLGGLELWSTVVDPIVARLQALNGTAKLRQTLDPQQYTAYVLLAVDTNIAEGGFGALYGQSGSSEFADESVQLLRNVGAPQHAAALARANQLFRAAGGASATGTRAPDFDSVNKAWKQAETTEGAISQLVARFIRAHQRRFFST